MIMQRELNDPRLTGLPSITRVKVSDDLSIADVFITVMGTPGQQNAALNALKHGAGLLRSRLTKQMTLRVAPFLKFHIDEDLKKELELEAVLRKVAEENAELDRKRAEAGGASQTTTQDGNAAEPPAEAGSPGDQEGTR
jgi:ribosome-binding factor A